MNSQTRTMSLWLVGSLAMVFVSKDPWASVVLVGAAATVAVGGERPGTFKGLFKLGLFALVLRIALFSLTGHAGATVLAHVPEVHLPLALGGLVLGGPIYSEVILSAAVEGVRLLAAMSIIGAFLATADTVDLLRMVPSFLFEAGLVLNIALVFAPQLARTASGVRDAQRLRGGTRRARLSFRPLVVPVLATALERSISLAESMDSRGFGHRSSFAAGTKYRTVAVFSGVALAGSASLWTMGGGGVTAIAVALAACSVLIMSLRHLDRMTVRTKYGSFVPARSEMLVALVPLLAAVSLSIFHRSTSVGPEPGLVAILGGPDTWQVLAAATVAAPAIARLFAQTEVASRP